MDSNKISVSIGKKIQSARLLKNLTQAKLAEMCGVSTNHISTIETGNSNCSFSLLIDICNALEITPNFLFEDFVSNKNDKINYISEDTLITYMKLKPKSKCVIDNLINDIYQIQKLR